MNYGFKYLKETSKIALTLIKSVKKNQPVIASGHMSLL